MDRKTARRYVQTAEEAGVLRDGGLEQFTDEVIGQIVSAVRPAMTDPLLAESTVDRLTSTADELVVEGESYRRRQRPTTVTKPRNEAPTKASRT